MRCMGQQAYWVFSRPTCQNVAKKYAGPEKRLLLINKSKKAHNFLYKLVLRTTQACNTSHKPNLSTVSVTELAGSEVTFHLRNNSGCCLLSGKQSYFYMLRTHLRKTSSMVVTVAPKSITPSNSAASSKARNSLAKLEAQ